MNHEIHVSNTVPNIIPQVPRKGGPGITQADLLVVNKIDLADAVGADLSVMKRDAKKMRGSGPTVLGVVKTGKGVDEIKQHIMAALKKSKDL